MENPEREYADRREQMVRRQLAGRGIDSPQVLHAMGSVPRHEFVGPDLRAFAYDDSPLPIGSGQTISQPYIVAFMLQALELEAGDRVLEVGAGSGYVAALLAAMGADVYAIERHKDLADQARERLERLGYRHVTVIHGDGTRGWAEAAPYDAIVVAAGAIEVPAALREQLAISGRLVIPVGSQLQHLMRITRVDEHRYEEEELTAVRFVPLIGD